MTDIISFNEHKAVKENDSRLWTPEDMLKAALRDLQAGTIKAESMCIHYYELNQDGGRTHRYYVSGLTFESHIALLNIALHSTIKAWQR